MSVTVQWDNEEQTIIRYDFAGRWTWDEFYQAYDQGKKMVAGKAGYQVILYPRDDASQRYMPPNFMTHAVAINRQADPNAGLTVIVSQSTYIHALLSVLTGIMRFVGQRYSTAKTLDEAREKLMQARKTAV